MKTKSLYYPTNRTWSFGSKWNSIFSWESIFLVLRLLSQRWIGLHHGVLLFNFPKGESQESEVLSGGIYIPSPSLTFPLLPVSKMMPKNRAEKLAEGQRGRGGNEWNKMDYEFENCQLSCIIQPRALAQWSATIQIFQLKWRYIQASKLTIK